MCWYSWYHSLGRRSSKRSSGKALNTSSSSASSLQWMWCDTWGREGGCDTGTGSACGVAWAVGVRSTGMGALLVQTDRVSTFVHGDGTCTSLQCGTCEAGTTSSRSQRRRVAMNQHFRPALQHMSGWRDRNCRHRHVVHTSRHVSAFPQSVARSALLINNLSVLRLRHVCIQPSTNPTKPPCHAGAMRVPSAHLVVVAPHQGGAARQVVRQAQQAGGRTREGGIRACEPHRSLEKATCTGLYRDEPVVKRLCVLDAGRQHGYHFTTEGAPSGTGTTPPPYSSSAPTC